MSLAHWRRRAPGLLIRCLGLLPVLAAVPVGLARPSPAFALPAAQRPAASGYEAAGSTYYVSTSGSDTNPGSSDAPFKTIQKGVSVLNPGDFLFVRSGAYLQTGQLNISRSGTATAPITIMTDPASPSKAIISGDKNGDKLAELEEDAPYPGWFLVYLGGSYIHFKNFEVEFSARIGIRSDGGNNVISGNNVHHTRSVGISVHGPNNTVEYNTVWRAADYNCCPTADNPYECGLGTNRQCNGDWPGGIAWGDTSGSANPAPGAMIRHNVVFHVSGEGFLCMNTDGSTVEDNTAYDNWGLGIDVDQCSTMVIQRNLVYYTSDKTWWRGATNPGHGIMLSNEGILGGYPIGHDRQVINNIIIGSNFRYWGRTSGSALKNDLIANNTIVESQGGTPLLVDAPYDSTATHVNTRFANNLVYKSSGSLASVETRVGLVFDHNLWSRTPPSNVYDSQTDVVADPLLSAPTRAPCTLQKTYPDPAHPNYPYETLTCSSPDGIKLANATSPAMGRGAILSQVADDYFGTIRNNNTAQYPGNPDIGAHEYVDATAPTPTFADVPFDHPFHDDIEILYQNGYTAGCAMDPLRYCPEATMNRAESSVFVERGIHTADYDPPMPSAQVFADVPLDSWAAKWVHGIWQDKYTAGCGTNPLVYCPWQGHTRAEGCVFYLRMLHGVNFEPTQPSQQTFADVPLDAWYAKWVQAASDAGLIDPCQASPELRFCPDGPLTRALAAHMMVKAKGLSIP